MSNAFVQQAGNAGSSVTTLSATISAPASGNQLVCFVSCDTSVANVTMSGLTDQVWGTLFSQNGDATHSNMIVFASTNCGTGDIKRPAVFTGGANPTRLRRLSSRGPRRQVRAPPRTEPTWASANQPLQP